MHTNSSSAKGASASLLEGDCMTMECVIQFSVISTLIYINTFCTFQVFHFILTSVCLCVFSENCFCIAQFLMETDRQRIHTRVAYKLLHLLIYCFHLSSTSLLSFVIFSCSVRNSKPSDPIDFSRRTSNCPLYCLCVTRETVISSNG